jgi:hypothetical protein
MKHNGFQRGLIFNHYPEFMFFATGLFKSDAHMMLEFARLLKQDKSITSDQQMFRNLRNDEYKPEELLDYLDNDNEKLKEAMLSNPLLSEDPKNIGGWYVLASQIYGLGQNCDDEDILKYLSFLEALCSVDKQYILQQRNMAQDVNFDVINNAIKLWLKTDKLDFSNPTDETKTKYLIAIILHWGALYENLMVIEWGEPTSNSGYDSFIIKCLPEIERKGRNKGKLKRTNAVLLEHIKNNWAEFKYKKNTIKWSELHSDIAKARFNQDLAITTIKEEIPDLDRPNQLIKKKLDRWKNGHSINGKKTPSFICIDDFKQYLKILKIPYDPDYFDTSLMGLLFIQLFELIQFEIQKLNVSDQFIVDEFAKYSNYQKLVSKRYEAFIASGVLKP